MLRKLVKHFKNKFISATDGVLLAALRDKKWQISRGTNCIYMQYSGCCFTLLRKSNTWIVLNCMFDGWELDVGGRVKRAVIKKANKEYPLNIDYCIKEILK